MFWLITQMWVFLLVAFLAGVGVGAWGFSGGRKRMAPANSKPKARAPLNLLSAPNGNIDDLTQIIGIDTQTAKRLNTLGVYHLKQIANWDVEAATWIEAQLKEPDRVTRERWSEQAMSLA